MFFIQNSSEGFLYVSLEKWFISIYGRSMQHKLASSLHSMPLFQVYEWQVLDCMDPFCQNTFPPYFIPTLGKDSTKDVPDRLITKTRPSPAPLPRNDKSLSHTSPVTPSNIFTTSQFLSLVIIRNLFFQILKIQVCWKYILVRYLIT